MTDKYEKVENMTVRGIAQSMSEGEVFYRNGTPIEIDSARCGIFLRDGKATMDLGSLRMELNDGLIYRKIETPWWDGYRGKPIMVRNSNDERWGYDVFFYYDKDNEKNKEKYPFMCNYFSYKFGRPLTKAEKDAIITEG
jgi:hypothetical protein